MNPAVRHVWLESVIRECQTLEGYSLPDVANLEQALWAFPDRIPDPQSALETVLLRGMLAELCLRWGDAAHRSYHHVHPEPKCSFAAGELAARVWRDRTAPPKVTFRTWAGEYARLFDDSHPLHRAGELRRHLDASFSQRLSIRTLALRQRVTEHRLQRDFFELTGMTIHEYVRKRRIEAAISLLQNTDDKIEWISRNVGWSSRKNFIRALVRHAGGTPTAIRSRRQQ